MKQNSSFLPPGQNLISTGLNAFIDRRKTVGSSSLLATNNKTTVDWFETQATLK